MTITDHRTSKPHESLRPRWVAAPLLLIAMSSLASAQLTHEQIREDLTLLIDEWLPANEALGEKRNEARDLLLGAHDNAFDMDETDLAFTALRATALSGNGHDMAGFGLLGKMPRLPIRFWWFEDGPFVVKAEEEHADLLGARIDAFGDLSPDEAWAAAAFYLPGNESWRRHRSIEFLSRLPMLAGISATQDPESITLSFTKATGETVERTLSASRSRDPEDDETQPWSESIFRTRGQNDDGSLWPHVLDGSSTLPAYLRTTDMVDYESIPERNASYVRIAGIRNPDGPGSLQNALFDVISSLQSDEPDHVILDLRYNTGGNFFNAVTFAFSLGHLLPPEGRILLLVNRCTFSAAIVTMAMIKHQAGAERITVIGEPIGDALRFWSEGGYVVLPNSGILVTWRDGLHDMVDGCQPDEGCWYGAAAFEHGVGELDPDIVVHERFEDFSSGRDLWLEAAIGFLAEIANQHVDSLEK